MSLIDHTVPACAPMHHEDDLPALFTEWQRGRQFSTATIRRRTVAVRSFTAWCAPMPITQAAFTDVEEWLAGYEAPRTRHAYRSDLNTFYRWAVKRHLCTRNPVEDVDTVRVPKSLPHPVQAELVPLIIATADDHRLRLACALAAYAGLRVGEIVNVDAADITLATSTLVVRNGKGRKDRAVPIIRPLTRILAEWAPKYGRLVPWTPNHCGHRIGTHMRNLGIDHTAHSLRHSAATEAARHADLRTVADFLGHSSVVTTEGYAALTRRWDALAGMYEPASLN